MNAASVLKNPLDDGILIQKAIKNGLISLSIAIILLSGAALWTIFQLTDFYSTKVNIITEQDQLLHDMRIAARERTLLMYAMVAETDPFVIDDNRMSFYSAGAKFAQARLAFIETPITDNERRILSLQGELTGVNRETQAEVVNLISIGKAEAALALLTSKVLPKQYKVLKTLDELGVSVENRKNEVKIQATAIENISVIILIAIVIIIILGAIYISRQTTRKAFNLISQLTNMRTALEKTNNELTSQKSTLDHHAIVSIADQHGNITYVNDKFCEISGYNREELIGKNHRVLKSDIHSEEFYKDLWDTITSGNVWKGEVCNRRKNGGLYWVESTISPFLDQNGVPYQYVSIRTDITHLLEARVEAEKANLAKSTFLMSMSHELRTPMNAVIGYADLLEMELIDEQLEYAKNISKSGQHLMKIITEILDLSSIETGNMELLIEETNAADLIEECLSMVDNMVLDKNIKINKSINVSTDYRVMVDRLRLKQALINYLSNAIKYNNVDGEIGVSIKRMDSDQCRISITDSGPGLNEEECAIIFNPFTRMDHHVNVIEGTGIGLTITKRMIERMHGSVGVDSEVGVGSVFWLEVPAA